MRFLKVIIYAVLTGAILAYIFYHNLSKDVQVFNDITNTVYVFQAGVFESKDNAYNYANALKNSVVYYDQEYYRIYIGVVKDYEDISILSSYFNKKNIDYFIKEVNVNNLPSDFDKYELLLKKIKDDASIDKINQKLLDILLTYLS